MPVSTPEMPALIGSAYFQQERERYGANAELQFRPSDGLEIKPYYVLDYPDWVQVVAIDADENLIVIRQYRLGEAELADRTGNLRHLRLAVGAGVPGIGHEAVEQAILDGKRLRAHGQFPPVG